MTDSLYFSYISTPNGLHSTSKTEIETEEIEITTQSNFGFEEFFIFVKALTKILTVATDCDLRFKNVKFLGSVGEEFVR